VIALVFAINLLVVFSLAERKTTNKRRKEPLRKPCVEHRVSILQEKHTLRCRYDFAQSALVRDQIVPLLQVETSDRISTPA
jgi:hypothetical protein